MKLSRLKCQRNVCVAVASFVFGFCFVNFVFAAELRVNILAVNGTDTRKEKEIKHYLPPELTAEDILDTDGLKLDYDVVVGTYYVHGNVTLDPKETKSIKVRVNDIWTIGEEDVSQIREQIQQSVQRLENTEYAEIGEIKKKSLEGRLDFILEEQEKFSGDVGKRIDRYRIYEEELAAVRSDAIDVTYWRTNIPSIEEGARTIRFIVEVENSSETESRKMEPKHYLPSEVRPEHIIELQGFEVGYDVLKKQAFLTKEEELQAAEKKRYNIEIIDIWRIVQQDIENLKDRSRKTYKLLENTEYVETAGYLIAGIKQNLEAIEESQAVERDIQSHIGAYRVNLKRLEAAERDVKALEDLLKAVREKLERSQLKNVLQRVKSLRSIADIAEAIFGAKPAVNNAWKIITAIVIFVGFFTIAHFTLWGRRSKAMKEEEPESEQEGDGEDSDKSEGKE